MHSLVLVDGDDRCLFPTAGQRDEQLIARLVGRLDNDARDIADRSILWPNEFNKVAGTVGAVRPGASLIAGIDGFGAKNALVSTLLLMGATSLLREVRDEVYDVQASAAAHIQADVRSDWRGHGLLS